MSDLELTDEQKALKKGEGVKYIIPLFSEDLY